LKRAYVNEKCAPEILPFELDLMRRVTESVETQESTVAASRAAAGSGASSATDDLTAHVHHAELNRIRFLMRAYYRTRLRKIETHAVHCLKEPDVLARLSDLERDVMLDPDDPENTMDLERDDILLIRYRLIKTLMEEEVVDLM